METNQQKRTGQEYRIVCLCTLGCSIQQIWFDSQQHVPPLQEHPYACYLQKEQMMAALSDVDSHALSPTSTATSLPFQNEFGIWMNKSYANGLLNICLDNKKNYLINRTESPALRRFAPTKTLHPVVKRCRFGWPVKQKLNDKKIALHPIYDHTE